MIADDGDIVRGLGFVSLYSAWVEEDIDDLLWLMSPIKSFGDKQQRQPVNQKLNNAIKLVRSLNSLELDGLSDVLESALKLFEKRNEFIHGRIYAGHDRIDYLQSGRPNIPTRSITSAELYKLANEFWEFRSNLIRPQYFRLPRAIEAFAKGSS
ncbi:MAG: hypothetical protein JNK31_05155 [Candidatus Competibacter sp.]|nr:hypothetical protein [Candidatus Competibacter sp.]